MSKSVPHLRGWLTRYGKNVRSLTRIADARREVARAHQELRRAVDRLEKAQSKLDAALRSA
jgi:hypothetical protein